ncbi:MAG: ABC transporter substrate-binding protein, partial [Butyricicoccus sp.]
YTVTKADGLRSGFAYVNFDGVLGNDDLREAVFMAIDHATMCDVTVGGLYSDGIGILPDFLGYNDSLTTDFGYDVNAANKKLDDAGIVDSDGDGIREMDGQNIDLNYITYDNRCLSTFAEAVQASLTEIGVGCTINSTDSDTEWNLMQAGEYDLCDSNWITAGTGDPIVFLANWYANGGKAFYNAKTGEGANYCNYENEEFDTLYDQYNQSLDVDERAQLVTQMEQILVDDCAVLLHGYYASTMISNSNVTGAQISGIDYYWLNTKIQPAG